MFCTRWAFIDLSAGPFSWGPAVGGEGVRTEASLPNVDKTIGSTSGSNDVCVCVMFTEVLIVFLTITINKVLRIATCKPYT